MDELIVQRKQPADVLYFDVGYGRFLAYYDDDTIASVAVNVDGEAIEDATELTQPSGKPPAPTSDGKAARVWFAGGVVNTDYRVSVLATTVGGLTKEYDFIVAVRDQ